MQGKLALVSQRARWVMRAPGNCWNLTDTVALSQVPERGQASVKDREREIVARRARFLRNALAQANDPD